MRRVTRSTASTNDTNLSAIIPPLSPRRTAASRAAVTTVANEPVSTSALSKRPSRTSGERKNTLKPLFSTAVIDFQSRPPPRQQPPPRKRKKPIPLTPAFSFAPSVSSTGDVSQPARIPSGRVPIEAATPTIPAPPTNSSQSPLSPGPSSSALSIPSAPPPPPPQQHHIYAPAVVPPVELLGTSPRKSRSLTSPDATSPVRRTPQSRRYAPYPLRDQSTESMMTINMPTSPIDVSFHPMPFSATPVSPSQPLPVQSFLNLPEDVTYSHLTPGPQEPTQPGWPAPDVGWPVPTWTPSELPSTQGNAPYFMTDDQLELLGNGLPVV